MCVPFYAALSFSITKNIDKHAKTVMPDIITKISKQIKLKCEIKYYYTLCVLLFVANIY